MAKISITSTMRVRDGNKWYTVPQYANKIVAGSKKGLKGSPGARRRAITLMSDFLDKQGPFKHATKSGSFSKASARPDMQGSLKDFREILGIEVEPTKIGGRSAQAFMERKQRFVAGGGAGLSSMTISGDMEKAFMQQTGITGRGTVTRKGKQVETFEGRRLQYGKGKISSSEIHAFFDGVGAQYKEGFIQTLEEKFENYQLIDYVDRNKKGQPKVKVLRNAAVVLGLRSNFKTSVILGAEQSRDQRTGKVTLIITSKLSSSAMQRFEDKAKNVTEKFHKSLATNFNTKFLRYSIERFQKGSRLGTADFLAAIISIAREFEEGFKTPLVYATTFPAQMVGKITQKIMIASEADKKALPQRFISGAQITTLVQKRMAQIMPKGPLRGPPLSPTVLTERSGRFRKSVKVVPNYRKNIMTFLYDPIYKTFVDTPRNPDELIQKSLRETVQGLFARQFAIVRGN